MEFLLIFPYAKRNTPQTEVFGIMMRIRDWDFINEKLEEKLFVAPIPALHWRSFQKSYQIVEEFALSSNYLHGIPLFTRDFGDLIIRQSERTKIFWFGLWFLKKRKGFLVSPLEALRKKIPEICGIVVVLIQVFHVAAFDAPTQILFGKDIVEEIFCGIRFSYFWKCFFKWNRIGRKLLETIREYANLQEEENVLDAFCGMGSIALSLSPYAKKY